MNDQLIVPLGVLLILASYGVAVRIGMLIQHGRTTLFNLALHVVMLTWLMGFGIILIQRV